MVLATGIPLEFYSQFEAYVRIEPRCRSNDWARGLQACTADPLWMLARQWQTGEFKGEDAGSPVQIELNHSTQSLQRIRLGDAGSAFDMPTAPLEAILEQERFELDWRARIRVGQQFERFVRASMAGLASEQVGAVLQAYRSDHYPIVVPGPDEEEWVDIDNRTRRYVELMEGRVVDGGRLLKDVDDNQVPAPPGIDAGQLNEALRKFNAWRACLCLQPSTRKSEAWQNQQLQYTFELEPPEEGAINESHLKVPEYRNGALDWYTFLMAAYAGDDEKWTRQEPIVTLPTGTAVGGMSLRWWAFEDSAIDFGKLDVAKPDLSKLLLMDFMLIYGDDWYSVPVPLVLSEAVDDDLRVSPKLVKIDRLMVKNVFGESVEPKPARQVVRDDLAAVGADPDDPLLRWEMFTLSPADIPNDPTAADVLLVPPAVGFREESPPIEEVRFLRDEGANMVWAVEHLVPNGKGQPVEGFDAQRERIARRRDARIRALLGRQEEIKNLLHAGGLGETETQELKAEAASNELELARLRDGAQPARGGAPRYRLATTVPENWFPFVPTNASPFFGPEYEDIKAIRLRRAQMRQNTEANDGEPIPAMSRILHPSSGDPLLWLEEATVPRSGLRTQLTAQRVRWVDGKTYVWLGRKVATGRGGGASGLRFDLVNGGQAR